MRRHVVFFMSNGLNVMCPAGQGMITRRFCRVYVGMCFKVGIGIENAFRKVLNIGNVGLWQEVAIVVFQEAFSFFVLIKFIYIL